MIGSHREEDSVLELFVGRIRLVMPKRTDFLTFTMRSFFADKFFEILDVIFCLFPTVATVTAEAERTRVLILEYLLVFVPFLARHWLEFLEKWALVILPIMRINAGKTVVIDFRKRTELSFEIKKKKIFGDRE